MNSLKYSSLQTPIGPFHFITHTQDGTENVRVAGFGTLADLQKRLPESLQNMEIKQLSSGHIYMRNIQAYFQGDLHALDGISYQQTGGAFAQGVWRALTTIPPGTTVSYKELAVRAGNSAAVRATGTACGQNHIMLLVPCHRVIKSDGQLGDYLYGSSIKSWLLAHEEKYKTP